MTDPHELPLFAFDAARQRHRRRRRIVRRTGVAVVLGIAALGLTIAFPPPPLLLWNASASVPIGLYRVGAAAAPQRGSLVIVWLPEPARRFAAQRHYLPGNVPAIKQVAAVAGDRICGLADALMIDGQAVATRLATDRLGRPLPRWEGCRTLHDGELLFLNRTSPASFDGRYFGVSRTLDVIGTAHPVWIPAHGEPGI